MEFISFVIHHQHFIYIKHSRPWTYAPKYLQQTRALLVQPENSCLHFHGLVCTETEKYSKLTTHISLNRYRRWSVHAFFKESTHPYPDSKDEAKVHNHHQDVSPMVQALGRHSGGLGSVSVFCGRLSLYHAAREISYYYPHSLTEGKCIFSMYVIRAKLHALLLSRPLLLNLHSLCWSLILFLD